MHYLAVDSFANTISGYLTPVLLVVVMGMIGYVARGITQAQEKLEKKQDDTEEKLNRFITQVTVLTERAQDAQVVQASNTSGIAKLTESAIRLNTTMEDHVKWHEQRYGPRPQ